MSFKILIKALILPESEDMNVSFFVIQGIQVTTVSELNLCTPTDLMICELCNCNVIWMDRVDPDSIHMGHYHVESTWVNGHSLYDIV